MTPKRNKLWLIPFLVGVLCWIPAIQDQTAYAEDFTADFKTVMMNHDVTGKICVTDGQYRMTFDVPPEATEKGPVIIVNRTQNKTHILDPNTKIYDTVDNFTFQAFMADPFQTLTHLEQTVEKRKTDTAVIAGYTCDHYELNDQDFKLADVWHAQALGDFPLKAHLVSGRDDGAVTVKTNMQDVTIELSNIQKAPVDPAIFDIPADFAQKKHPQKKTVADKPAVRTTLEGAAPWGRRIAKGGELRVKTDPKRPVKITLDYLEDTSVCAYAAIPQGKTVEDVPPTPLTIRTDQRRLKFELNKHKKTEWVVVRVEEGLVYAKIINEKDPFSFSSDAKLIEHYLTENQIQGIIVEKERKATLTITGDSQDSPASEVVLKAYRDNYKDKVFDETVEIKNGETKVWEFLPDQQIQTCEIAMGKTGGIKVKLEQPSRQKSSADTKAAPKVVYTTAIKPTGPARQNKTAVPNKAAQIKKVEKSLFSGDVAAVEACLNEGMDPNEVINGFPLLQKAVKQSTAEVVKLIIARGGDLGYKDRFGNNLLFSAQSNNRYFQEVIPVLVEAGVLVDQNTPVYLIAQKIEDGNFKPGVKQTLEYLLSKGANVNAPISNSGNTLLMFASKMAWLEPVAFYLDHGADVNAKDNKGNTALSWAKTERKGARPFEEENRKAIIALLESKGAK